MTTGISIHDRCVLREWEHQAQDGRSAEQSAVPVNQWAERQAHEDDEQVAYLVEWRRTHPQTAHRTTWGDVRAFAGAVLVLAAMGGALWVFVEWQALGGWMH